MHSLQDIINEIRSNGNLCTAIENNNKICFNKAICKSLCSKHYWRLKRTGRLDLKKTEKTCKFIDCNIKAKTKGYCQKHYKKYLKTYQKFKKCKIEDCNKIVDSKGFCQKHYYRYKKFGDPREFTKKKDYKSTYKKNHIPFNKGIIKHSKCLVSECSVTSDNNPYKGNLTRGLCAKHYSRWHRLGTFNLNKKNHNKKRKNFKCSVPECDKNFENDVIRKNLCNHHYYIWHRYGHY